MNKAQKLMLLSGLLTLGAVMLVMKLHAPDAYSEVEEKITSTASPTTITTSTPSISTPTNNEVSSGVRKIRNIKVKSDQLLYFNVPVTEGSVNTAIVELGKMTQKHNDVYLLINSPGGSVFDGVRLTSFISANSKNIHTSLFK